MCPSAEPRRPAPPAIAAATRAERRRGARIAVVGLVAAAVGMGLQMQSSLGGNERPQLTAGVLFLAAIGLYGTGLHQVIWAPASDAEGVPRKLRPAITAFLCIVTWWILATAAGLTAAVLRDRALGG